MRRTRAAAVLAVLLAGCSAEPSLSPLAKQGRNVYLAQCTSCHNSDPSQPGPVGPPLTGTSPAVLEAKLLHGAYPPGYPPKRATHIMPVLPGVRSDVPALAAYLK